MSIVFMHGSRREETAAGVSEDCNGLEAPNRCDVEVANVWRAFRGLLKRFSKDAL